MEVLTLDCRKLSQILNYLLLNIDETCKAIRRIMDNKTPRTNGVESDITKFGGTSLGKNKFIE